MENPHNERQAILLQRIVKSVMKCNDIFRELNQCLEEIVQANEEIRLGADLASKYRKNAQFNIEALRASGALPSHSTADPGGNLDVRDHCRTPTIDHPQP